MQKSFLISLSGVVLCILFIYSCRKPVKPAPVRIIPKPVFLAKEEGSFTISPKTKILLLADSLQNSANFFNEYLSKYYGFKLKVKRCKASDTAASNAIILGSRPMTKTMPGGYTFKSGDNRVVIMGVDAPGTFYGIQTLIQLLPAMPSKLLTIADVNILDYPQYRYRGMMLDCSRHFFDTAFIKKFINFIALHKMNRFHWHLTGDQGWRIQIKKYPKLTSIGAWRDSTLIGHFRQKMPKYDHHRYGGFYTQAEIKYIVKYAQKRYITIIPEIEMPGHSSAAIAAYPRLAGLKKYHVEPTWGVFDTVLLPKPYTFHFYENVLDEVMKLFPSHYIHIGGDEVSAAYWKNNSYCQHLMKEKGMTNAGQIENYFIEKIAKYLHAHGRDIIGWDEIVKDGLAPGAEVMSWRGQKGGIAAARQNHDVIMTPGGYCYFDHYQAKKHDSLFIGGYTPLKKVYSFDPVGEMTREAAEYVKGIQANVWTEYIRWPSTVEYQIFPRIEALAEDAWDNVDNKNFVDFSKRIQTAYKRYDLWGVNYYKGFMKMR